MCLVLLHCKGFSVLGVASFVYHYDVLTTSLAAVLSQPPCGPGRCQGIAVEGALPSIAPHAYAA